MQPDPIGLKSSNLKRPKSLNLYSYVENDPINYIDLDGTFIYEAGCVSALVWVGEFRVVKEICQAVYKASDDRGGEGPGPGVRGGEPLTLPPDEAAAEYWEKFKQQNPGCQDIIDQLAQKAGVSQKFDDALFNSIKWLSAAQSEPRDLKKMKMSDFGETGRSKDESLWKVFGEKGAAAVAIWTSTKPTVITTYQGYLSRPVVVAHEMLHILFRATHEDLANKLGLGTFTGNDAVRDQNASTAISSFLNNNCVKRANGD